MAKVQFGVIATDLRQKIGGVVYARNRGGAYVRTKVTPINHHTAAQNTIRANMTTISKRWGSVLTDLQRLAWTNFAQAFPTTDQFNQTLILSGLAIYVRCNQTSMATAGGFIDDPPADQNVGHPKAFGIQTLTAPNILDLTDWNISDAAGQYFALWATPPLSPGRNSFTPFYHRFYIQLMPPPDPLSVGPNYVVRFGNLIAGKKVAIQLQILNPPNGALSNKISRSKITT